MRELQGQRGFLALMERFLILHASKIVALMMFWAAMAQPGAIGWLLLGAMHSSPAHSLLFFEADIQITACCHDVKRAGYALEVIECSAITLLNESHPLPDLHIFHGIAFYKHISAEQSWRPSS